MRVRSGRRLTVGEGPSRLGGAWRINFPDSRYRRFTRVCRLVLRSRAGAVYLFLDDRDDVRVITARSDHVEHAIARIDPEAAAAGEALILGDGVVAKVFHHVRLLYVRHLIILIAELQGDGMRISQCLQRCAAIGPSPR